MCQHLICKVINIVFGRMLVECKECGTQLDRDIPASLM